MFAALGVTTGLLDASLPQTAQAQSTDQNPLPGLVGGLLPLPTGSSEPSPSSTSEQPPSDSPSSSPPSSSEDQSSGNPLPRLPVLSPPSSAPTPAPGKSPGGLLPGLLPGNPQQGGPLPGLLPPGGGQLPILPALPPALHLPVGAPSDPRPGPGRAWTLSGSKMKLGGSRYGGFSDQQVAGRTVKTLHFTVDSLEITNLVQRADLGNGKIVRTAAAPGSVSTIRNGPIELYVEDLSGNLSVAGLPGVPLRLSPDTLGLPNLDLGFLRLPDLTLNNVVVNNADLSGGKLFLPGVHIGIE